MLNAKTFPSQFTFRLLIFAVRFKKAFLRLHQICFWNKLKQVVCEFVELKRWLRNLIIIHEWNKKKRVLRFLVCWKIARRIEDFWWLCHEVSKTRKKNETSYRIKNGLKRPQNFQTTSCHFLITQYFYLHKTLNIYVNFSLLFFPSKQGEKIRTFCIFFGWIKVESLMNFQFRFPFATFRRSHRLYADIKGTKGAFIFRSGRICKFMLCSLRFVISRKVYARCERKKTPRSTRTSSLQLVHLCLMWYRYYIVGIEAES